MHPNRTMAAFRRRRNEACAIELGDEVVEANGAAADETDAWLLEAPQSHVAESYRALRPNLRLSRAERPPRVVLFVSGSPDA